MTSFVFAKPAPKVESSENKSASSNLLKIKVEKGETVFSLAKKYNVRVQDIVQMNKLKKPYALKSDQVLQLPKNRFHLVKEGDTLYGIARNYKIDVKEIIRLNNLKTPYKVTNGTKLIIPSDLSHVESTENKEANKEIKKTAKTTKTATPQLSPSQKKKMSEHGLSTEPYDPGVRNVISKDIEPAENKKPVEKKEEKDPEPAKKTTPAVSVKSANNNTNEKAVYSKTSYSSADKNYKTPFIEKDKTASTEDVKNPFVEVEEETKEPASKKEEVAQKPSEKNDAPSPQINISKDISEINNQKETAAVENHNKAPEKITKEESYKTIGNEVASGPANFIWPVKGKIASRFGPKEGGLYNDGINIIAKDGTSIKAADSGVVVYSGNELRGYGNLILIKHNNGYLTAYAHAKEILTNKGDIVKKGQTIAYVGDTGMVSQPQLHFSIRNGRKAVDPEKYLSHAVTSSN